MMYYYYNFCRVVIVFVVSLALVPSSARTVLYFIMILNNTLLNPIAVIIVFHRHAFSFVRRVIYRFHKHTNAYDCIIFPFNDHSTIRLVSRLYSESQNHFSLLLLLLESFIILQRTLFQTVLTNSSNSTKPLVVQLFEEDIEVKNTWHALMDHLQGRI